MAIPSERDPLLRTIRDEQCSSSSSSTMSSSITNIGAEVHEEGHETRQSDFQILTPLFIDSIPGA